jgi:hypothetical protein
VDFSEAMDLFVNIDLTNYFPTVKVVDWVHAPVDRERHRPRWTTVIVPGEACRRSVGTASPCAEPHSG